MSIRNNLKAQILTNYLILIAVPLTIVAVIVLTNITSSFKKRIETENRLYSEILAEKVNSFLDQPAIVIKNLYSFLSTQEYSENKINDFLRILIDNSQLFENIEVLDQEYKVINSGLRPSQLVGQDRSREQFIVDRENSESVQWSRCYVSFLTNSPTIVISLNYQSKLIVGYLKLSTLNEEVRRLTVGKAGFIAIVDQFGTYIAHTDSELVSQQVQDAYIQMIQNSKGKPLKLFYENKYMSVASIKNKSADWFVIIAINTAENDAFMAYIVNFFIVVAIFGVVFALTLAFIFTRYLLKPFELLMNGISKISTGMYEQINLNALKFTEFINIGKTLNLMVENVKSREFYLNRTQQQLKAAQAIAKIGSWEMDFDDEIITLSEQAYKIFEVPLDREFKLSELKNIIIDEDKPLLDELVESLKFSKTFEFILRIRRKNGEISNLNFLGEIKSGEHIQGIGTVQDITELKTAMDELKLKNDALDTSLNAFAITIDAKIIYVNKAFLEYWGYRELSEVLGRKPVDFYFNAVDYEETIESINKTGVRKKEFAAKRKDGSKFFVLMSANLHIEPGKPNFIISTFIDITKDKEAQTELMHQQEQMQFIFDTIPALIYFKDTNCRITWINKHFAEKFKVEKEEFIANEAMNFYGKEDLEMYFKEDLKVIKSGEPLNNIIENPKVDDSTLWFKTDRIPMFDSNHRVTGLVGFSFEITDLIKAQEEIRSFNENLESIVHERTDQLVSVNKELESFSYSVSHDLRAPLRAISGFSSILFEDYHNSLDDEGKELLTDIIANTQRMSVLIEELLQFSRLGRKEIVTTSIKMSELINDSIKQFEKEISQNNTEVILENLEDVCGDYTLIRQVIVNLISNAIKYSSKKETPSIQISSRISDNEVIYSVKDNGCGFDMKYYDKLFNVFQRLHSDKDFEGTGVGLAIAYRIITKHNGKIWADSVLNESTTFYFSLPIIQYEV